MKGRYKILQITIILPVLFFVVFSNNLHAQSYPLFLDSYPDTLNKKRLTWLITGQTFLYATSMTALYYAWYKDYPQSKFHWIDDNDEWMQIDKLGHATTAAYIGKFGYEFYRWAGVERKKAIWIGGSTGFIYLTTIEILDGFSEQWGASMGDFIANATGTALFIGQQLGWDEQRFLLKWSYHETRYAQYRPDLLGTGFFERMLKDYNGQTYWLSGNVKSFLRKESGFPNWLNIAVGYGAEGMTGARSNPKNYNGEQLPEFPRYRKLFLTLDLDLTRIKTRSGFVSFLLHGFNFLKIPFPTVEYNKQDGFRF
ncbi:MAG: YfiM family protein, partial [Bacteroidales bacterium]|nr:YfiM family protein [Bacteroidales bacterium]